MLKEGKLKFLSTMILYIDEKNDQIFLYTGNKRFNLETVWDDNKTVGFFQNKYLLEKYDIKLKADKTHNVHRISCFKKI